MNENQINESLLKTKGLVEEVLNKIEVQAPVYDLPSSYAWFLSKGNASITIKLTKDSNEQNILKVFSFLFTTRMPVDDKLLEELLQLNLQYVGISFGLSNYDVILKADREIQGLDHEEIYLMLHRVGNLADFFIHYFAERYPIKENFAIPI